MIEVGLLAVALALDATAASAGIGAGQCGWRPLFTAAGLFGLFQAGMAGLGCWGGAWIAAHAAAWDHWIAFGLLGGVGLRAIHAALTATPEPGGTQVGFGTLIVLAFATSVDALASGVTLPLLAVSELAAVLAIGAVTAGLALAGGALGRWAGVRVGAPLEVFGGVVLVLLGAKILVEHLIAGT